MASWTTEHQDAMAELKSVLWDDDMFEKWCEGNGLDDALRQVFEFKWSLTEQISARKDAGDWKQGDEWATKISRLVVRVNQRRTQLKNYIRKVHGDDYLYDLIEDIREENRD